MNKITVNDIEYMIHAIYDLYGADINGNIIHIIKKIPNKGKKNNKGYMRCIVRKHGQNVQKTIGVHRFIFECHHHLIPPHMVIDHINDVKDDNRLCNLQLLSHQENCKKSAKTRDYSFVKYNYVNRKYIKATCTNTDEVSYYKSLYSAGKILNINPGVIKMVCEVLNNCKSGISKKDGHRYIFEYIKADELPEN